MPPPTDETSANARLSEVSIFFHVHYNLPLLRTGFRLHARKEILPCVGISVIYINVETKKKNNTNIHVSVWVAPLEVRWATALYLHQKADRTFLMQDVFVAVAFWYSMLTSFLTRHQSNSTVFLLCNCLRVV